MTIDKPNAPATQRNREPILQVLRVHFAHRSRVLEIGSGTGQHAVYFAAALPHLVWQCSDRAENLPGIRAWLDDACLPNAPPPIELAMEAAHGELVKPRAQDERGALKYDAAFSANTLHIMSWPEVEAMFAGLDAVLADDATVAIYGPFKLGGRHTSDSNAAFDAGLKARAPHMGVRDIEAVHALARVIGLEPIADVATPANNRCIVWRRSA
jgi:hypothetical protein